jgi:hypothetical protein
MASDSNDNIKVGNASESQVARWRRFERKTVFVSCSSDVSAEVGAIRNVMEELNRQLPQGDQWDVYHWTWMDETRSATGTWQEYIPRASDPNVGVVICIFGERVGLPLPCYFQLPQELALPSWVRFPWPSTGSADGVPLTGTLFELLDAIQGWERSGRIRPEILCFVKADRGRFEARGRSPEQRGYGFEHLYERLKDGQKRIRDRKREDAYNVQIDQLDKFCDAFFRMEGHPYACFGSEEMGPDGCIAAFRERLLKDLPRLLGITNRRQERRELKGLAGYEPEDHQILFGRDRQIIRLLERLRNISRDAGRRNGEEPLLLLMGRSGEGKSSLLRAGLIGRIRCGRYSDFGVLHSVLTDALTLGMEYPPARLTEAIDQALGGRLWEGRHRLTDFLGADRLVKVVAGVRSALAVLPPDEAGRKHRLFIGLDRSRGDSRPSGGGRLDRTPFRRAVRARSSGASAAGAGCGRGPDKHRRRESFDNGRDAGK